MKRKSNVLCGVLCTLLLLLGTKQALAQANAKPPTQLTYQGFLTDANGVPFGNDGPDNKTVIFRIYDTLTGGTPKWSSQQVITVDKGYFSALLGQGSAVGAEPFSADLTGVFSGSTASDRYLELNVDGTPVAPRLRFLAAPYALLSKSATELVDPSTGASSLAISGGNLTSAGSITSGSITSGNVTASSVTASGNITATGNLSAANLSGNGANLTSLNASQITSGTLANARTTATSSRFANTIASRDGAGNSYFGDNSTGGAAIGASGEGTELRLHGNGFHHFAIRNKLGDLSIGTSDSGDILGSPMTPSLTLGGNGNVGIGTTAPSAKLEVAGQVTANSFKIKDTPTLVLTSISRGGVATANPVSGITATFVANNRTANGRQNVNNDQNNWWKASRTDYGTILYTATIVVPLGEVWEVAYKCNYYWATDDAGAIIWTLNDALLDDGFTYARGQSGGAISFDQDFILSAGTHVVRVKGVIGGGSGDDYIYFPDNYNPSHIVVKKYKTN